jgi:hypothetical protein
MLGSPPPHTLGTAYRTRRLLWLLPGNGHWPRFARRQQLYKTTTFASKMRRGAVSTNDEKTELERRVTDGDSNRVRRRTAALVDRCRKKGLEAGKHH